MSRYIESEGETDTDAAASAHTDEEDDEGAVAAAAAVLSRAAAIASGGDDGGGGGNSSRHTPLYILILGKTCKLAKGLLAQRMAWILKSTGPIFENNSS